MKAAIMLSALLGARAYAASDPSGLIRAALPVGFAPVAFQEPVVVPVPAPGPSQEVAPSQVPVGVDAGVVPPWLWSSLEPTDAASLAWLSSRIPGFDATAVRTLTPQAADAMLADCAARGLSPLQFFTDAGFRGYGTFYFPQELLAGMYARYDFRVITPVSGKDENGVPFVMQGMVAGEGRLDILYDRDDITFRHQDFNDGKYTVKIHVVELIFGSGDLGVSGVAVHVGIFRPKIQRIVKISPTESRIETSLGTRNKPTTRVTRR